jgi:hypothetical protein
LSEVPEKQQDPSADTHLKSACPSIVCRIAPVATSQTFIEYFASAVVHEQQDRFLGHSVVYPTVKSRDASADTQKQSIASCPASVLIVLSSFNTSINVLVEVSGIVVKPVYSGIWSQEQSAGGSCAGGTFLVKTDAIVMVQA